MATTDTFQCSVITPERAVLECESTFVAFPAHDGEMGVLTKRAPLLYKLGIGQLRVESPTEKHLLFIDGGFVQVVGNRLTILTEQALPAADIDLEAASQALVEARAMKGTDVESVDARNRAIQRAKVQIKLSRAK